MRIKIQIIIEADAENGAEPLVEEIARMERADLLPETLGLTLSEAKAITAGIQKVMTTRQITEYLAQNSSCPQCASAYAHKGRHPLVFRTLFGKLSFNSPRLFSCNCQPTKSKTFSTIKDC